MRLTPGAQDEAFEDEATVRPHYADVLARLGGTDLRDLARRVGAEVSRMRVTHGARGSDHPFVVDAVPRIVEAEEWRRLAGGLVQRVRALEAFLADAYGERRAERDGVVPPDLVDTSIHFHPELAPPVPLGIAGPDVVRDQQGELVVLEDNVRTPTMLAYLVAARRAVTAQLPPTSPLPDVEASLRDDVRALLGPGRAVVLGDRATSGVAWELDRLGEMLGLPVLEPRELRRDGADRVVDAEGPVDVVLRRTSEERLRTDAGDRNELGELLLPALRAGTVRVVNPFGTGVADDKRTYVYVEDLVRYFTGEEPLLRSVPGYDLADAAQRRAALERIDELVFKPRFGSGGFGVTVGPRVSRTRLTELREQIEAGSGDWVAQELVHISTHPTIVDGELAARHGDLRPYAFSGPQGVRVLPGAFSRFALAEGDLVVNASQGGGGRDVWVPLVS